MTLTPRYLVESVSSVPSLPVIFERLSAVTEDPRSSSRDIEAIVREDSSLAGRLLRLANSAYFGFPARVDTLSRAITLVGSRQLRDLAIATAVMEIFRGVAPSRVSMKSFWRHSVACGLVARILASWRRETNCEQHFVTGLVHDIGRLILLIKQGDNMAAAMDSAASSASMLYECEARRFGFDHAAVGSVLLQRRNLPEYICAAVAFHHAPERAGVHKQAAAIVHVADILVNGMACGTSGERYVPPLNAEA